ncbi:hypothetical protein DL95DRAFT_447254 [Leptodontidium sp. 2 PMI_412]|nr:hypothetical protein DL95DRAFT_447254 [Leptodontidium sp. 2 PMI_412]
MEASTIAFKPMLACSMRVMRNLTKLEDLLLAWPSLEEKSLCSPPTLSETERRLFLDLPDEDLELATIRSTTGRSREQLIHQALSNPGNLTDGEAMLLGDRFWSPVTEEEHDAVFGGMAQTSEDGLDKYFAAREFDPDEAALTIGASEDWKRKQAPEQDRQRAAAEAALPYAKEWIQQLYKSQKSNWGFVVLYDAAAQQLGPERLGYFNSQMEDFFRTALMFNGSADIISRKWMMLPFNSPKAAIASEGSGEVFRRAFKDILNDAQAYQNTDDVNSLGTRTEYFNDGVSGLGLLTNTFLVIDLECVGSVIVRDRSPLFDEMRIRAYEADFPVLGRKYEEGYEGFTWVRLDQLVYNFYELRLMNSSDLGMDKIWKMSQGSRNKAFISMDPEEAGMSITNSNLARGFTRESVLGRRWYAMKDLRGV